MPNRIGCVLQLNLADRPVVQAQPVRCESPSAGSAQIRLADGACDQIAWQSEETYEQHGSDLQSGLLQTDGLMALVRVRNGRVVGYVLGEGTYLKWDGKDLVQCKTSVCVSADTKGANSTGRRQARTGLPAVEPVGLKTYKPGPA